MSGIQGTACGVFASIMVAALAAGGCGGAAGSPEESALGQQSEAVAPGSVLLVVGNATLNTGDNAVLQRLQAMGFTVTVKSAAASATADATGRQLVVVSSTVTSGDVGTKFKSVAVPVLTWESGVLDDLGMTAAGALGTSANQTRIKMLAASSDPMSAGFTGSQLVTSANTTFSWGKPGAAAVVVASLDADTTKATLFRYETGTAMVGLNAPERRVGIFLEDATAASLTTAGQFLMDGAIRWAAHLTAAADGAVCTAAADCASASRNA